MARAEWQGGARPLGLGLVSSGGLCRAAPAALCLKLQLPAPPLEPSVSWGLWGGPAQPEAPGLETGETGGGPGGRLQLGPGDGWAPALCLQRVRGLRAVGVAGPGLPVRKGNSDLLTSVCPCGWLMFHDPVTEACLRDGEMPEMAAGLGGSPSGQREPRVQSCVCPAWSRGDPGTVMVTSSLRT